MSTATESDTFLDLITESWDAPHCESTHESERNRVCSHTPVAIGSTICVGDMKFCQNAVNFWASVPMHHVCMFSDLPYHDCHTLLPLGG